MRGSSGVRGYQAGRNGVRDIKLDMYRGKTLAFSMMNNDGTRVVAQAFLFENGRLHHTPLFVSTPEAADACSEGANGVLDSFQFR